MQKWFTAVIIILYIFQLISLAAVIFIDNKDPVSTLSWILVLTFLPVIGFILYLFLGRGLTYLSSRRLQISHQIQDELHAVPPRATEYYVPTWEIMQNKAISFSDPVAEEYLGLIKMNYKLSRAAFTQNNAMRIYTSAWDKYRDLFRDIEDATESIHVCYFIISNTEISHKFIELLAKKATEGISVHLIYDAIGNLVVPRKIFRPLTDSGGHVYRFFPLSPSNILHANYRNHHKIVVIDGLVGYTGGMNIGDEYMGLHPRKTPWRDTHLRITGDAVASLQFTFIMDMYYTTNDRSLIEHFFDYTCFPEPEQTGDIAMQIVTSGPDDESEAIKRAFIKIINDAKNTLYIQTPYLMPDQAVMQAIQIAASSGVKVKLMLPGVPDKRIVYHVTLAYIQTMLDYGVEVYIYNGFLHSKMIVADDKISTIGTTNLDMRSFSLHFELNAIFYDREVSWLCGEIFRSDLVECYQMTQERYDSRGRFQRLKERVFRLMAPLM